jgi:AcrR family transcriptional regulator
VVGERRTNTREQIRSVALEMFAERGYAGTSLREIAERLGVTKAAVYYHFSTKEDILASLLEDFLVQLDELIAWTATQPRSAETRRAALEQARADMALAARLDRKNAYAVLWQDIAERRAKQKGVLTRGAKGLDMKTWPAPLIRLFAGEIKQDAVLTAADDANPTVKQAHTCEANFYGGQYALIEGQRDDAQKLFEAAAKDCPHGFLEGIAATAELKGMGQKVGAN